MDPMQRIAELVGRIGELSADELTELDALIRDTYADLQSQPTTEDVVTQLTTLADAAETHGAEVARRDEALAQLEADRAAAEARLQPPADQPDDTEGGTGDEPGDVDQPADQGAPEPVTAAARPPLARLAGRARTAPRPAPPPTGSPESRTTATVVATGREVTTRQEISRAMAEEINRSWGQRGPYRRPAVAAVTEWPEDRRLTDSGEQNMALVAAALDAPDALVAAGGLCAPVENIYDVEVIGDVDRPVRDALPGFNASRGGVNLRPGPYFGDWAPAVGQWTLQNDIDAATSGGPDPVKGKMVATCPGFQAFTVYSTYARVEFRNVTSRFDPEGTQANLEAVDIWWARYAENLLLQAMATQSLAVTSPKTLGATRDILAAIDRLIGYYRNRFRLSERVVLDMVVPQWLRDMLRADITRGEISLDALAVADEMIGGWFARRGIMPVWHMDGRSVAQAGPPAIAAQAYAAAVSGSPIPEFPDQIEALIYRRGDFILLDGGTLDLGVVRDSDHVDQNTYEVFKETFEGLAYQGVPGAALQLIATVDPNGLSAGRLDTSALSD